MVVLHFATPHRMLTLARLAAQPMPESPTKLDTKVDPFKPAQPRIPGVPEATAPKIAEEPPPAAEVPKVPFAMPRSWVAIAVVAVLLSGLLAAWWSRSRATTAARPSMMPADAALGPPSAARAPEPALPNAPGVVGTTEELAKPWAAKKFHYRNKMKGEEFRAMVVHLPEGGYWAFSLEEPYGKCELELVADLGKLRKEYGFTANHPMLVDPCTHAVFDLLRYGNAPGGLVRGEVVAGAALRPPIAIEVRLEGRNVVAARSE